MQSNDCSVCGQPAELIECSDCGVVGQVVNCGHSAQPQPIAALANGVPVCDACARERQADD